MGYSLVYTTSYLPSSKGPKKMRGWGEVGKVFSNGYVKKVRCFGAGGRGGGGVVDGVRNENGTSLWENFRVHNRLTWCAISGRADAGSFLFFFIIVLCLSQFSNSKFFPF